MAYKAPDGRLNRRRFGPIVQKVSDSVGCATVATPARPDGAPKGRLGRAHIDRLGRADGDRLNKVHIDRFNKVRIDYHSIGDTRH